MAESAWSDMIRADHECTCSECDPSLVVHSQRQGDQHVGVRFWDADEPEDKVRAMISLNGTIIAGVFEAILGESGTIWRYRGLPSASVHGRHRCETCRRRWDVQESLTADASERLGIGVCTEKLTGAVELRAKPRCEGCEIGGDASHNYLQGVCTGGRHVRETRTWDK